MRHLDVRGQAARQTLNKLFFLKLYIDDDAT